MNGKAIRSIILVLIGIVGLLSSCQRRGEATLTPNSPVSLGTADLTITSLRIPGISADSISIDQTSRLITVRLPATVAAMQLTGTAKFGCSNCGLIYNARNDSLAVIYLCGPVTTDPYRLARKVVSGDAVDFVDYSLRLVSAGQLTVAPLPDYVIGGLQNVQITVKNFYESSVSSRGYFYLKRTGQLVDSLSVACYGTAFGGLAQPNLLQASPTSLDIPGEYRFELVKENGRRASTTLFVKKGIPRINGTVVAKPKAAQSFRLNGVNLYQEDGIDILVKQPGGYQTRLKPTVHSVRGSTVTLKLPPDCPPGYYYVQAARSEQEFEIPAWSNPDFVVLEQAEQPYMADGILYGPGGSLSRTIRAGEQVRTYVPIYERYEQSTRVEYVLTDINNPARRFTTPVYLPDSYYWGGGFGANYTVPKNLTPGRYQITPRHITAKGDTINGLRSPHVYIVN